MATDYRRANYIPLSIDRLRLDFVNASYSNMKFVLTTSKVFVVTDAYESNLPGIAFTLYQDPGLWWVLAMYNGIIDPIDEIVTGLKLNVPDLAAINAFLDVNTKQQASSVNSIPTITL